jgi:divalent metal cation (Fe/Co/Zn/Cd) transporter
MTLPNFGDYSKVKLARLVAGSIIRTLLGLVLIFWILSLVPEQIDGTIWLPIGIFIVGIAFYGYVFKIQLRRIRKSRFPALSAIEALILIAVSFLAIFAAIYVMISGKNPDSFTEPLDHFTAFYFALTVLATVGFGDITPVTSGARLACMIQMGIDIGFIAVLLKVVTSAARKSIAGRSDAHSDE